MPAHCRPDVEIIEPMIISETANDVIVAVEISKALIVGYGRLYECIVIDVKELPR